MPHIDALSTKLRTRCGKANEASSRMSFFGSRSAQSIGLESDGH
jgi:hypothetical protein